VLTTRRITDLMSHLERTYCAKARRPTIGPMSTRIFGRVIIGDKPITEGLRAAFFEAIRRDREGEEATPEMLLRSVSTMLLAIDASEVHVGARHHFETILEQAYLKAAKAYYDEEASRLIATSSVPQYIEHFFARLVAETRRTGTCLDSSTVPRVNQIVSLAFIANYAAEIISNETSGVHALLRSWRVPELKALYAAFAHLHDTGSLIESTASYFLEEGTQAVTNADNIANPITYVEKLINLRERMRTLLTDAFTTTGRIDRHAEAALFSAFEKVVNHQNFTPEYLSRLLDSKLRGQLPDSEIEKASDEVMSIFARLSEKDLFENAYRNHLARRLLAGRTASVEDQERIFIQRLKKECGVSVASSLEGMFADRATSDDMMEKFRERLVDRGETVPIAIHVFVLTAGFWPPPVQLAMILPPEMDRTAKVFRMFYMGRFHGRKFEYSCSNGSVDTKLMHGGRRFELNVPTVCAPVLLRFQGDESETIEEIAKACGMTVPDTARAVASLIRPSPVSTGVLAVESAAGSGPITGSTRVKFNAAFKSKNLKLRIALAVAAKDKDATGLCTTRARDQLDEDRKFKIDAAVVRIMKSRRILAHQTLVSEVVAVLKTFSPSPEMIKKRIEHLIEREFLERTEQRDVYNYLA
jgi:cullin 3